MYSKKQLVSNT